MTRSRMAFTRRAFLATTSLALAAPALAAASPSPAYRDRSAPLEARVRDLLNRMTLEEKAAQLCCMWERKVEFLGADRQFSESAARTSLLHGIGHISRPSDVRGYPEWGDHPFRSVSETVTLVNAVQRFLVEQTRLGIPALFHDELAHGLLANDATIFPGPPALASTWDPELIEQVFTVAAREARLRGTHLALTPVVDLARDPRYGRVEEFFGEDPHLVAEMGLAAVRGMQGRARPLGPDRVFVTLKHFVHAVPQGGRNIGPADIGERALREAYLVPFARIVRDAHPAVIMPSYNEVGGVPAHANRALLQATGRKLLGFEGAFFSDYDGIGNLASVHHVAADEDEAAILALDAGVQSDFPEGKCFSRLPALVRAGRADETRLDEAVAAVLRLKFEAGLFENPYLDASRVARGTQTPAAVALARKTAARAIVMLKNDGVLPFDPRAGSTLAVIGPNAVEPLFGGYSGSNGRAVGVLDGLRRAVPKGVEVAYAEGVRLAPPDAIGQHRSYSPLPPIPEADDAARIAEAVAVARRSDVVLLVLGDIPAVTREAVHISLPGDRATLGLWGRQDALVEAIAATGKPVVALLLNGRALAVPRLAEVANALLEGWYLGQEGGNAVADIVFGARNPGGKLAVSFPRSAGALPVYYDRHPSAQANVYLEDGADRPLFPFGHGLSYTGFELGAPELSQAAIAPGDTVEVAVRVSNTGDRFGDEVVQLYIRDDVSSVPRPVLELKAFQRIGLAPGESRTVRFRVGPEQLAFWDADMNLSVEPGTFTISAGPNSVALKSATLTVRKGSVRAIAPQGVAG